jgi:SAM-dependent methyltransferase
MAAFDRAYAGTPPWDIDGPQPAFVGLAEAGRVAGPVLDIGCGTGELALYLAGRGMPVLGVDGSPTAIAKARAKASARAVPVRFAVADATALQDLNECFATVVDSGLLHVLSDAGRVALVAGLHGIIRPGGRYHVLCFSEHAAAALGPRLVTQAELRALFTAGWSVESILPSAFTLLPTFGTRQRDEPRRSAAAWLASFRRE